MVDLVLRSGIMIKKSILNIHSCFHCSGNATKMKVFFEKKNLMCMMVFYTEKFDCSANIKWIIYFSEFIYSIKVDYFHWKLHKNRQILHETNQNVHLYKFIYEKLKTISAWPITNNYTNFEKQITNEFPSITLCVSILGDSQKKILPSSIHIFKSWRNNFE